jgi:hypothetical protein
LSDNHQSKNKSYFDGFGTFAFQVVDFIAYFRIRPRFARAAVKLK